MEFKYSIHSGKFFIVTDGGSTLFLAQCYSGHGTQRNCPACTPHIGGPIPQGKYGLQVSPVRHAHLHAPVIVCTPNGHDAKGRSGFLIHGDNAEHDASSGCIVMELAERKRLAGYVAAQHGGAWMEVI